jgi:L-asparaginase
VRPGGYVATGGHGGIVGNISHTGRIALTYLPVFKNTYRSELKITTLPNAVKAAKTGPRGIEMVDVAVKDGNGKLLPGAIPVVTISADGGYTGMEYGHDTAPEVDLMASIEHKLSLGLLTGFVIQGLVPYGRTPSHTRHKLMLKAAFNGIPVAMTGRGAPMGFADPTDFQIGATNLTAIKARLLLMACLLKFGSLPAARDPNKPTSAELDAIRKAVSAYQAVFDTH